MEFTRLFDIPYVQEDAYPQEDAITAKKEGKWRRYSTKEVIETATKFSAGLLEKGIEKGDHIGLISFNRPEWNIVDIGMQQIGAVNVPLYPNISAEECAYILNDAGIKTLFVSTKDIYDTIKSISDDLEHLENLYTFDEIEGADHWTIVTKASTDKSVEKVEQIKNDISEDELVTIVYTSGTTGKPKGVMLTHHNIVSNVQACISLLPVGEKHRCLSFLPLNHIFERMLVYLYMVSGVSIYYAENLDTIGDNIKEVKPHIFTTVPRLLEKIYEKIVSAARDQNPVIRGIFFWAVNMAKSYELEDRSWWYDMLMKLHNKIVFAKWREALGGQVKLIVSGGAALNPQLARIFTAAQLPILEGYGLTETSPVISVNGWEIEKRKFGTVGQPIEGVEVKIADDGEILCKGPNVMQGYYNNQEETDKAIKDDWFYTGDVGEIDDNGFLKITDRKGSVFKTSGGKKVAPQPIENKLKESFLVDQALVIGEGRKMVTALIAPDFDNLEEWCEKESISFSSKEEIIENDDVKKRFSEMIDNKNKHFSHVEQIKKFRLVPDSWDVDSGELTPTQKVKRGAVVEKYSELIEEMYKDNE